MNKQICRACGHEMVTESIVPMTFCTDCGASLAPPNNGPTYSMVPPRRGKLNKGEKIFLGALIAVPTVLILGGIGAFALLFYTASRFERTDRRFPTPRPVASPKKASNLLMSFGSDGLGQGQFKRAKSLAVDKSGNLYVGDGTLRIQKFDPTGKFLQLWYVRETSITVDEQFTRGITDLAIDSKGTLYVVVDKKDLLRYDSNGKFIDKLALYGEKWMNKQQEARILDAVMLPDDKLAVYATSFPDGEYIILVSPDGKGEIKHKHLLRKREKRLSSVGSASLLINASGDIFLFNGDPPLSDKPYIYRFKSDGSYVDRFTWESERSSIFFAKKLVALNSKGEIYAFNSAKKQINVLSVEGVMRRSIPLDLTSFENMVVDPGDNIFIVRDDKVEKYAPTGN